ncbi:DEAD/DEAH box helicase [Stappia sp. F7233]|uniref:DEAD-box ATP-dependent RNA helicase RhpA n=1 Tax=Stappia albiluteola TaxID=2758565 RepID=A0A839AC12_9HYPH|nr:DEAD/DEAH box helicase [Stappia albiluteola]MBA5776665.1 DEAD/DEAH box helicase [Stappia albiluteola]
MSFSALGLSEKVIAAVEAAGYKEPTPIQAGAIPHVLERRDVLGLAQTGTGKTASFTLPMLTLLEKGRARARMPRTLILEPTRELAAQVEENFLKYGTNHKLNVALLIGGTSFGDQDKKLDRGVDVLIATPGRLLDHSERGKLLLQGVEILVIDEADRMLDMGFIPDIERICKLIPFTRQTLFFSATMPPEIQRLVDTFLHNPVRVEVAKTSSTAETVTQKVAASPSKDFEKRAVLRSLIDDAEDLKNAIIFCNRKRDVQTLFRSLERHGYSVGALHGDMDQRSRMSTLDSFRKGEVSLLVASDVAARGLDIPDVSHVFNYDVPIHSEDYVHRIGRTGRAGRSGTAYTVVTPGDEKYLSAIEKLIDRKIEWQGEAIDFSAEAEARSDRRRRKTSAEKSSDTSRTTDSKSKRAPRKRERSAEEAGGEARTASRSSTITNDNSNPKPADTRKRPKREHSGRDRGSRAEEAVVGLGDHVPAFLLRDPRPKRTG